jgi:hypothetical protein|tara:strand:+ start:309 stop:518 length:210 start_codon:yes stop_codon:yes gene_type:complete
MGFNKHYLSEDNLRGFYLLGGAPLIIKYLDGGDALLSTDEFSTKLLEDVHLPKEELLQKIDELFTLPNK